MEQEGERMEMRDFYIQQEEDGDYTIPGIGTMSSIEELRDEVEEQLKNREEYRFILNLKKERMDHD